MKRIRSFSSLVVLLGFVMSSLGIVNFTVTQSTSFAAPQTGASATEAVGKTGVAGARPTGGNGSQTINWTIDYGLNSATALANISLNDTWSTGQTLVAGSVHTPGGNWTYSRPNSTSIKFTSALVAPNAKGAGIPLSIPLTGPINFTGGGDGFNPTITASGKIVGINHHTSNAGIWCYDMTTNAVCPGYKMSSGFNTALDPIARAIGNKIYIVGSDVVTSTSNIYCWDTDSDSLCGSSPHLDNGFDRLEVANGKLYTLVNTGQVDCFDPSNDLARCSGYPVQVNVPAITGSNGILPVGNSLYVLNGNGKLNCLNLATRGFCSGWSSTPLSGVSGEDILFPRLNAGGSITGICQIGGGTPANCYDLDGSNPTSNSAMSVLTTGTLSDLNDGTYYGSRVYFGGGSVSCWNWATNAVCAGAGFDSSGHTTAQLGSAYGITHDPGCLYTFGHAGSLYSLDPTTGETPCGNSTGTVTVNIDDYYNAVPGSIAANWDKVSLTDVNLTAGAEFNSIIVKVINPANNSVVAGPTEMIGSAGEIDLSGVSSSIRTLQLQVVAKPVGTTAWQDNINPKIWLTFISTTPVQFSYKTTIMCAGLSQNHTNTISTLLDPHSSKATVSNLCASPATTKIRAYFPMAVRVVGEINIPLDQSR